jgi:hypothetical protein
MTPSTRSLGTDELLRLVADRRRRTVLSHLRDQGTDDVAVAGQAAAVVANDRSGPGGDSYERALIELQHDHLPRLADAGVVGYDRERGTVRYRPHEGLEDLLWVVSERLE